MNERLFQFLRAENISQAQFADSINVARAGVSHIMAGRNKPGWDFIINTMNRYPTLNIEWLLTGKGKMYKGTSSDAMDDVAVSQPISNPSPVAQPDVDTLFGDYGYTGTGAQQPFITVSETEQTLAQPSQQPEIQPAPQPVLPTAVKKPNVAKIIVFFDDGTFQECK